MLLPSILIHSLCFLLLPLISATTALATIIPRDDTAVDIGADSKPISSGLASYLAIEISIPMGVLVLLGLGIPVLSME